MLNFEHNLLYYDYRFCHLKTAKTHGQVAPHKPLLLLSVIELVEAGKIDSPQIMLSDELVSTFNRNVQIYVPDVKHYHTNIGMPFYHMHSEPFWRLLPREEGVRPSVTSISGLRCHYVCAEMDNELFCILTDAENRVTLQTTLINTYLKHD